MSAHEQFADDLALYAMGALEESERDGLQTHLSQCAACRRELQHLCGDAGLLALASMGPEPSSEARARLLSAVAKEPRARATRQPGLRWWLLLPLGATIGLAAVVSVLLWRQNNALKRDVAQLLRQSVQDRAEVELAKEVLALLNAPDAVRVTLVATDAKPQPQGKAIYRPQTGSLVFLASNFAPLPPQRAYELWLLPTSGAAPIPVGVFKLDARGNATVLMPSLPKDLEAKAFAITIEPETGSITPTMPIVLAGGR